MLFALKSNRLLRDRRTAMMIVPLRLIVSNCFRSAEGRYRRVRMGERTR